MGAWRVLSYLCSFYLSCLFALSLGDWMDVSGLVGFYPCLLFVGFMGLVWMRVYLRGIGSMRDDIYL